MSPFFRMIIILIVVLSVSDEILNAQKAIASAGGSATGSTGSMSYTIGQLDFNTTIALSGTITEGVQQPFEVFIVTGVSKTSENLPDMEVFPNPAAAYLQLTTQKVLINSIMIYQLFDMNGHLIKNGTVLNRETYIDIQDLAPAEYLLKVLTTDHVLKTFKIIKK